MVGSIADINNILDPTTEVGKKNKWLLKQLKSGLGENGVDLISGGPPCQSFSLAGMRDHSHQRNQLPGEFAKSSESIWSESENVTGSPTRTFSAA